MSKKAIKILQALVSIGLLGLVFYQVGLFSEQGRDQFLEVIKGSNVGLLLLSVVVGVLVNVSSALKWFMLIRARNMIVGYWRVFSYYLIGQFYNLFLPTSVGGDVIRSYQLGQYTGKKAEALASVFVERYTGVLVLLILAALAVVAKLSVFNIDFIIASVALFVVLLGLMAWLIIDPRFYNAIKGWLIRLLPITGIVFKKADAFLEAVNLYRDQPMSIVWAFINSLIFYFLAVVNIYVTALVFSQDIIFVDILVTTPIIMLIMNVPLSIGNIGLMEFAYSKVFDLMGYSPAIGLSVAILMRLKSLFDGALGGVLQPLVLQSKPEFEQQDNQENK